jgi:hypothetical protein
MCIGCAYKVSRVRVRKPNNTERIRIGAHRRSMNFLSVVGKEEEEEGGLVGWLADLPNVA